MAKPLSPDQRRAWIEKIQNQQTSGLSIERWCQDNQIAPHRFYYWRRRLFQEPITRSSFSELTEQRGCSISVAYQDICIKIESPTLKRCFQALREIQC